jgi:hypothetical protein
MDLTNLTIPYQDGKTYIHNHFTFVFLYEKNVKNPDEQYIVGFEVYPES